MKSKLIATLLTGVIALSMVACGAKEEPPPPTETPATPPAAGEADLTALIEAAKKEGELVVYGSCEDPYIAAACKGFEDKYGIKTSWQRLAGGEVQAKIEEENGNPSADVWFGGTSDPQSVCASNGFLEKYEAQNAKHLLSDSYRDADGYWYGIYRGVLGFFYNMEELDRLKIDYPKDWDDLLDPKYQGLIWFSNPNTASTAKLTINTFVQMRGLDKAMEYFKALDKNVAQYTKSGGGPSKSVGSGECVIGIGFLHDSIYQITQGYDNIGMCVPSSGTACEVGATSIFKGCAHPNAAKLWIEYALTPECVERAAETGSFQFLVLDNAKQPEVVAKFNLDPNNTIDYDFADAKANTVAYVERFFNEIGASADDRFKTE
ncbi:MAG: ABC transporter substrate-binding protein [Oscillospiraceae bacterium]